MGSTFMGLETAKEESQPSVQGFMSHQTTSPMQIQMATQDKELPLKQIILIQSFQFMTARRMAKWGQEFKLEPLKEFETAF